MRHITKWSRKMMFGKLEKEIKISVFLVLLVPLIGFSTLTVFQETAFARACTNLLISASNSLGDGATGVDDGSSCGNQSGAPYCGDGVISTGEICDTRNNMGCAQNFICANECYSCGGCVQSTSCCGDGVVGDGEDCDAGAFCQDGTRCQYNTQCSGIGDGKCQYREMYSGDCKSTCTLCVPGNSANQVLVDSFNTGGNLAPNNLGGNNGVFVNASANCELKFGFSDALGSPFPAGSREINPYDVRAQNAACGLYMELGPRLVPPVNPPDPNSIQHFNATSYNAVSFYLKAISPASTAGIKVELKDRTFQTRSVTVHAVTNQWVKFLIPFSQFGNLNLSELTQFGVTIDGNSVSPNIIGALAIDQVKFETAGTGCGLCGDGIVNPGEQCDVGKFCSNGKSCQSGVECNYIGDGLCQYRAQYAGDCNPNCTVVAAQLLVADLNEQNPPNELGGNYGPFAIGGAVCTVNHHSDVTGDPFGYSRNIHHDVSAIPDAACGMWMQLGPLSNPNDPDSPPVPFDASAYKTLNLYLKGGINGSPSVGTVKIQLNDMDPGIPPPHSVTLTGTTKQWKKYSIPLASYSSTINFAQLKEIVAVVDNFTGGGSLVGDVSFDHVSLSTNVIDLKIANFALGHAPNNIGGAYGAFTNEPNGQPDPTQGCTLSHVSDGGASDRILRIDYDVNSLLPAFCGMWMKLGPEEINRLNPADYQYLRFRVRGDGQLGFTPYMKVELKRAAGQVGAVYIIGITSSWREFVIPLTQFFPLPQLNQLSDLNFVFDDFVSNPEVGTIYVDDIRLTQ